jgi:hypothetical protein
MYLTNLGTGDINHGTNKESDHLTVQVIYNSFQAAYTDLLEYIVIVFCINYR